MPTIWYPVDVCECELVVDWNVTPTNIIDVRPCPKHKYLSKETLYNLLIDECKKITAERLKK